MPSKEISQLLRPLTRRGYWRLRAGKHDWLVDPDGRVVRDGGRPLTVPLTPSDYRAVRNLRARLRRLGLLP